MFKCMIVCCRMYGSILLVVATILTTHLAHAQNHLLDSLKKELTGVQDTTQLKIVAEIAYHMADYDPLESKHFADRQLRLARRLKRADYESDALSNLAYYYSLVNKIDSATFYQRKVLEIGIRRKSERTIASAYNNLGTYYWQTDDLDSAMEYFLKSLRLYEKIGKKSGIGQAINNVAGVLVMQKKFALALPYYKDALRLNTDLKDSAQMTNNLVNLGITFEELEQFDSAIFYYNKTLAICNQIGDRATKAVVLGSLGNVSRKTKNYQQAVVYYSEALALNKLLGTNDRLVENQVDMGKTYILLRELDKAEEILLAALRKAKEINTKSYTNRAYNALAELYEARSDYRKAYQYKSLFSDLNDTLFNQESSKKIMELNIKYESEKKAQQIALHEKEIEVLNEKAKVDQLRKSVLGGGLVASMLIGGLAFYSIRQKLNQQKAERAKEKEDYEKDLAFKKKELAIHTLHLVQKSELLESIHEKLEELKKEPDANKNAIRRLVQLIKNDYQTEKDWQNFKSYFEQVHEHFDAKLREHFNDLTHHEIRLATLLKMNLSTKEIAAILNISPDSVNKARYRLRKKLNLSTEDSLENFLLAL